MLVERSDIIVTPRTWNWSLATIFSVCKFLKALHHTQPYNSLKATEGCILFSKPNQIYELSSQLNRHDVCYTVNTHNFPNSIFHWFTFPDTEITYHTSYTHQFFLFPIFLSNICLVPLTRWPSLSFWVHSKYIFAVTATVMFTLQSSFQHKNIEFICSHNWTTFNNVYIQGGGPAKVRPTYIFDGNIWMYS